MDGNLLVGKILEMQILASCHPGDKNNTLQKNLKKKKRKATVINIQERAFVFPYKTN